jgi:HD-GYP domain-containing protein (c-di-GMP phosphodiesterase class II)
MSLRKRAHISGRKPKPQDASQSQTLAEHLTLTGRKFANSTLNAATLQQVRSVAGAVSRLWRDLAVTSNTPFHDHEEHSYRVGLFSWKIARLMGLSEERAERIFQAAYLHDVGIAAVPESIMLNPGCLTVEERKAIQVHPLISCQLLGAFLSTEGLAAIALSHHERFDGDGYPNGLPGAKIPVEARVVAIADSLDAMISRRPYRSPFAFSDALSEITRGAGRQFDPSIVEVLARKGQTIAPTPNASSVAI